MTVLSKFVEYDQVIRAKKSLRRFFQRGAGVTDSPICFLVGDARSGKSRLVKNCFKSELEVRKGPNGDIRPAVFVEAADRSTFKGIAQAVLRAMEYPFAFKPNVVEDELMAAVIAQIELQETRLIIIDEVELPTTEKGRLNASNFFRSFSNRAKTPLLLVGLPDILDLAKHNPALRGRNTMPIELKKFSWAYKPHEKVWRQIMMTIEAENPRFPAGSISEFTMAAKIHSASDGLIGFALNLLDAAIDIADDEGGRTVKVQHIAAAFDQLKALREEDAHNPFSSPSTVPAIEAQPSRKVGAGLNARTPVLKITNRTTT